MFFENENHTAMGKRCGGIGTGLQFTEPRKHLHNRVILLAGIVTVLRLLVDKITECELRVIEGHGLRDLLYRRFPCLKR